VTVYASERIAVPVAGAVIVLVTGIAFPGFVHAASFKLCLGK
jgi:hypothetical protein